MEKSSESFKFLDIKLLLIGTRDSGKKVFANKWSKNIATENDKSLISTDCYFKILKIDGYLLRIQVSEFLFGGNINHTLTTKIFQDSLGAIFISDATNPEDLEIIQKWKHNLDEDASFINGTPLPSILIENKIDEISLNDLGDLYSFLEDAIIYKQSYPYDRHSMLNIESLMTSAPLSIPNGSQ